MADKPNKEFIQSCINDVYKKLDEQIDIVNAIADEWNNELLGECRQEVLNEIKERYNAALHKYQATNMTYETFRNLLEIAE